MVHLGNIILITFCLTIYLYGLAIGLNLWGGLFGAILIAGFDIAIRLKK